MNYTNRDPIIREVPVSAAGPTAIRSTRSNTALVFLDEQSGVSTNQPPTIWQRLTCPFRLFEIDTALHPVTVLMELPTAEEAFTFSAHMHATWSVHDPATVVRLGVRDAHSVFRPFVEQLLRPLSRRFTVLQSAEAEAEINNELKAAPFKLARGIELSNCFLTLQLDESAQLHLASITESHRALERQIADHEITMLREQHNQIEAVLRQQLEQQQADHDLMLKRQRIDFYRWALADHNLGVIALRLIEHPEDIGAIAEMLQGRKDSYLKSVWETLDKMIMNHHFSMADLDPVRQQTVNHLRTALDILAEGARVREAAVESEGGRQPRSASTGTTSKVAPQRPGST